MGAERSHKSIPPRPQPVAGSPSQWSLATWPIYASPWLLPRKAPYTCPPHYADEASWEAVRDYLGGRMWVWPGQELVLLTDVHADADAFLDSLEAAEMIARRGPLAADAELTKRGSTATLVLAGDFLDKGPHNIELLRAVSQIRQAGVKTVVLAGNHDIRTRVGVSCFGAEDPRLSHMFVRMGKKSVRLFREIHESYSAGKASAYHDLGPDEILAQMVPKAGWHEAFPEVARGHVSEAKIARELHRITEKQAQMLEEVESAGMSLVDYYAAVCAFRQLFLDPEGEFGWLFSEMRLCHRQGAVLFLHAGVDDQIAELLGQQGHEGLNAAFDDLLARGDWFELYNGPVGNVFRTKYRMSEPQLTERGVAALGRAGIHAIAHGHRNITLGQRMIFRRGLLNFECDASIDRNTRALEGLSAHGAAATVFRSDGSVLAVSSDFPSCKRFDPAEFCAVTIA